MKNLEKSYISSFKRTFLWQFIIEKTIYKWMNSILIRIPSKFEQIWKIQLANPVKFLPYKKILIILLENFSLQNWIKPSQIERSAIKHNFWLTLIWRIYLNCCDLTRKKIEINCVKLTNIFGGAFRLCYCTTAAKNRLGRLAQFKTVIWYSATRKHALIGKSSHSLS
jgi:hypothetical protein